MTEARELTDEHVALWIEGCTLLAAMTAAEYHENDNQRSWRLRQIDKELTWRLVSPGSVSLFDGILDGPPEPWALPASAQYVDWIPAQTWRNALIQATGLIPKRFSYGR
jgi:hypothetical protein